MTEHALVIGEALVDVVRRPDGSQAAHPGGSPANVALGLARLGRRAELLTYLGDDAYGTLVRHHVESSGATIALGSPAPHTSVATATLDAQGVATYDFDLTWDIAGDATTLPSPLVVHTGSIAAVLEPGATAVTRILSAAREGATVTYDPNVRPSLMGDRADAAARIERLVALSDVVKVSDEDLAWLFPGEQPADAASLARFGARTRRRHPGRRGCTCGNTRRCDRSAPRQRRGRRHRGGRRFVYVRAH